MLLLPSLWAIKGVLGLGVAMEKVEEANRAAVESCHRVLSLLSQSQDQVQYTNLVAEAGEAVSRFKRVASMLSNGVGHARVRIVKRFQSPFNHKAFLDHSAVSKIDLSPKPLQLLPKSLLDTSAPELDSSAKNPRAAHPQDPSRESKAGFGFIFFEEHSSACPTGSFNSISLFSSSNKQQNNPRFNSSSNESSRLDMYRRNVSGINLKFDSQADPTMSSPGLWLPGHGWECGQLGWKGIPSDWWHKNRSGQRPLKGGVRKGKMEGKCATPARCHVKEEELKARVHEGPASSTNWYIPLQDSRESMAEPIKVSSSQGSINAQRGVPARKHVKRCLKDPSMVHCYIRRRANHTRLLTHFAHTERHQSSPPAASTAAAPFASQPYLVVTESHLCMLTFCFLKIKAVEQLLIKVSWVLQSFHSEEGAYKRILPMEPHRNATQVLVEESKQRTLFLVLECDLTRLD
uniref:DNA binding protein n=1 Tax=Elaeis oleifera TaxID=80265 RepID=Q8SAB5_ELAOL|nr:DNA binding protein [Elaeis oleifera]